MPPVTILYARVSTVEQASSGLGLEAQRAWLEAESRRRGWHDTLDLTDGGVSGATLDRPAIQEALELLAAGQAERLAVAALDRLGRNTLETLQLIDLFREQGWELVARDLQGDLEDEFEEFRAGLAALLAQLERRKIGRRTREALAAKKARGERLGRPSRLTPEIRGRITRERAAGRSLRAIAAALNADEIPTGHAGRQWWPSSVRAVLELLERERTGQPPPARPKPRRRAQRPSTARQRPTRQPQAPQDRGELEEEQQRREERQELRERIRQQRREQAGAAQPATPKARRSRR
jgi:DNA invertase Pin-like site-specific DNA recombinase